MQVNIISALRTPKKTHRGGARRLRKLAASPVRKVVKLVSPKKDKKAKMIVDDDFDINNILWAESPVMPDDRDKAMVALMQGIGDLFEAFEEL